MLPNDRFCQLLAAITETHGSLNLNALADEMHLPIEDVGQIFSDAVEEWNRIKYTKQSKLPRYQEVQTLGDGEVIQLNCGDFYASRVVHNETLNVKITYFDVIIPEGYISFAVPSNFLIDRKTTT